MPSLRFCLETKREPGQLDGGWVKGPSSHCLCLGSPAELQTQVQHEGHQGTSTWHLSHQSENSSGVHGGLRGIEHVKGRTHNLSSVPLPCNPAHTWTQPLSKASIKSDMALLQLQKKSLLV